MFILFIQYAISIHWPIGEGVRQIVRKIPRFTVDKKAGTYFNIVDIIIPQYIFSIIWTQALVSFKKYMPPPLPYIKVNFYPFPLPHFASILFAYLWSFRWPNYIVTLPRYFSFRLPHLTYPEMDGTFLINIHHI